MKNTLIFIQMAVILVLGVYMLSSQPPKAEEEEVAPAPDPTYKVFTFDLPQKLDFAGEEVPLDQSDIRERLDREIHTNIYWNTSTVFLFKRASRWLPQIEPILIENGIPADFKYLAVIESSLRNDRSPKGAVGFWQILKSTGRELGLEINREVDERYSPLKSTEAACRYLNKAYKKFGNWTAAAASYNVGMRGISRRMEEQKVDSYYDLLLNEETSRYIFRVLALKEIMENPEKYGYSIPEERLYQYPEVEELVVDQSIPNLVDFSLEQGFNYKTLKRLNPWLRSRSLTVRPGKTYQIRIPVDRQPPLASPQAEASNKAVEP